MRLRQVGLAFSVALATSTANPSQLVSMLVSNGEDEWGIRVSALLSDAVTIASTLLHQSDC